MDTGWVKLHRKLLNNRLLGYDHNSFILFVHLLLLVRKENGTYDAGRFQLSQISKLKPSTVYKCLKRLEKAGIIALQSNNKFTLITICNWHDYQQQSNNKVTTPSQRGNTKQELIIENTNIYTKGNEFQETFNDFIKMRNKIKKPMTNKAIKLIINRLEKLYPNQVNMQITCLNQSIENCWQSVFVVKHDPNIATSPVQTQQIRIAEQTPEEREKARLAAAKVREQLTKKMSI